MNHKLLRRNIYKYCDFTMSLHITTPKLSGLSPWNDGLL